MTGRALPFMLDTKGAGGGENIAEAALGTGI